MMIQFFRALEGVSDVVVAFLMKQILFSSIIFIIIFVLVKIFKRLSPYWHLGLWALVLLRLLLPPNLSHSYSVRTMLSQVPYYQQISRHITLWLSGSSFERESASSFHFLSLDSQSVENFQSARAIDSANQKSAFWRTILFSIWLLGVVLFICVYIHRMRQIHKLLNSAHPINHAMIDRLLGKWQRQFQIKRKIRLFSSEEFLSPFTMGVFHPKIYIPKNFLEPMSLEHLESIIAHELAHIKRCDDLWLKIQNLIQIVYFFHPVIWYVNRKIILSRECICDRMVLSYREMSAESYGKSMMNVLKLNLFGAEGVHLLPGFGNHKNALKYRIKNITGGTTMKHTHFFILYASLIILGTLILPMAGHVINKADPVVAGEIYAQQVTANSDQKDKIAFICPMSKGKITAPFGKWIDPFSKKEAFHNGVDIAAPKGTAIYAAASGQVIVAESAPKTHGNYIVLQHENNFQTFYSHCDTLLVQVGQQITAGEVIASVGQTGKSTGPHLHFEIRKDGAPQDPKNYLNFTLLKIER